MNKGWIYKGRTTPLYLHLMFRKKCVMPSVNPWHSSALLIFLCVSKQVLVIRMKWYSEESDV